MLSQTWRKWQRIKLIGFWVVCLPGWRKFQASKVQHVAPAVGLWCPTKDGEAAGMPRSMQGRRNAHIMARNMTQIPTIFCFELDRLDSSMIALSSMIQSFYVIHSSSCFALMCKIIGYESVWAGAQQPDMLRSISLHPWRVSSFWISLALVEVGDTNRCVVVCYCWTSKCKKWLENRITELALADCCWSCLMTIVIHMIAGAPFTKLSQRFLPPGGILGCQKLFGLGGTDLWGRAEDEETDQNDWDDMDWVMVVLLEVQGLWNSQYTIE